VLASIFVVLRSSSASFDARDVKVVVDDAKDLFGKDEDKERLPLEIDDDDARKLDKGRSMEEEDTTVDDAFNIMVVVVLFCAMCSCCLSLLKERNRAFSFVWRCFQRENPKTSSTLNTHACIYTS
jgi:hypothetical protein